MLGWLKEKRAAARAAEEARALALEEQRTLRARIEERFPPSVLFRIPPEMQQISKSSVYIDDPLDRQWSSALQTFPRPPQTETERARREDQFWRASVAFHTVENPDGSKDIRARGALEDYFRRNELWIFRFYYAATGVMIQTIFFEQCQLLIKFHRAKDKYSKTFESWKEEYAKPRVKHGSYWKEGKFNDVLYDYLSTETKGERANVERLTEQWEAFANNTVSAHQEKWGGWYSSHIMEVYRQQQTKPTPRGNIYGEGGFANLHDVQGAQARQGEPARGAQSQTFED